MKYFHKILVLFYSLVIAACGEQIVIPVDTASLYLSFRATYSGEPLILNQTYNYEGNQVKFSKINFYISDLVAINDDGETELSEIQFIDLSLTHNTLADAEEGFQMSFSKIPIGTYSYLRFGVGVPSDLNKTTPADYATNHPLGTKNSAQYSEDLNSYFFVKIEGEYDKDGNEIIDENDISFVYYTGTDRNYKSIEFERSLTLSAGETSNLDFELNVKGYRIYKKQVFVYIHPPTI